eukprot:CAMPEP_0197836018 /NCGR_PEP_ID=MMETSP1437-20131217/27678_1 /TAXON_ID=49252 ORGANISM="Eucampia antarctica, Strain CCMP1452" /NCGR_SAMPLE_ID=MMETSP1437 /ASSEMBLY_ACC=CAM_ASM_001096 /LENGTH=47 /DNA_ID= /DNA_START= /DNA_END= /DNA_ORIENTATION=
MTGLRMNKCKELRKVSEEIRVSSLKKDLEGCFNAVKSVVNVGNFFAW